MTTINGVIYLPQINITSPAPVIFGPRNGDTDGFGNSREAARIGSATRSYILNKYPKIIVTDAQRREEEISKKYKTTEATLAVEVAEIENKKTSSSDAMVTLDNKISATSELISRKGNEYVAQKAIADSYYKRDFFSLRVNQFIPNAISDRMQFTDPDANYRKWFQSLQAAYNAKYI